MSKLWQKEYTLDKLVEKYTIGNDPVLDMELLPYDCRASKVHAAMLHKIGIISENECKQLVDGLDEILDMLKQGKFIIEQDQEDCHTAIEVYLTSMLGDVGKKIHTARSRNDQVLTALRLYTKEKLENLHQLIDVLDIIISKFIKKYGHIPFPGYTHTRKAMPSSIKLWAGAIIDSMKDNRILLDAIGKLIDQSPLGTAAGYGIPLDIDRDFTARELGFNHIQQNSVYAQLSRGKFDVSVLHICGQIMLDLNRVASDLIFFSMPQFGYFELPDEFCTGSSIMPQKKNPDVLELIRANYHVVSSRENQIKTTIANLGTGYHRDLQLTKEPTMCGLTSTLQTLAISIRIFESLKVNTNNCQAAMTEDLFATEKVYDLIKEGIPFRDAYKQIAKDLKLS